MKFIKGARTWRSILGTQTFFWPLTHPTPPPPRYSINQPLSKGLGLATRRLERLTKGTCSPNGIAAMGLASLYLTAIHFRGKATHDAVRCTPAGAPHTTLATPAHALRNCRCGYGWNHPQCRLELRTGQSVPGMTRPRLSVAWSGGGMAAWAPPPDPPTHPPTSEKFSSGEKKEIYQRGPQLEVDFRYTNLFFGLWTPPLPRFGKIRHYAMAWA